MTLSVLLEMDDGSYYAHNDNNVKSVLVWHKSTSIPVAMVDRDGGVHERPTVEFARSKRNIAILCPKSAPKI